MSKMMLQSGHEVEDLKGDELKKQLEDFTGYQDLVRLHPGRWIFTKKYTKFADKLYDFQFKSSDVIVLTYPKCGTTWTQEIVWTMINNPDLNHPMAHLPVMARSPFLDMDMLLPEIKESEKDLVTESLFQMSPNKDPEAGLAIQMTEALPDPRTIKLHLPLTLLPPSMLDTAKVIYVARNPKDLIVSYHHHSRIIKLHGYVGNFEDFVQHFLDDDLVYSPYWLHVKEAWEKRDHPNMHFVFFEEMKANPMAELKRLNTFLNTNLTEAQLEAIAKYTSFKEMKARFSEGEEDLGIFHPDILKKEGGFFRKGDAGDWKGKFTPELEAKVDEWTKKNMSSFGIDFKYSV